MGVFQLGKYTIQNLNVGWRVGWESIHGRHHMDIDVEQLINNYLESHIQKIIDLVYLLDAGPDNILNDPLGFAIIYNMPDQETIPGNQMQGKELTDWHRQQLLKGYNRVQGTSFTFDMIRSRLP